MTYLPWAGSLESHSVGTSPDSPESLDSHADPAGRRGPDISAGIPIPSRPANPDDLGGRSQAGGHTDSGAPAQAAAIGQAISNRLFSASLDLHFVLMARYDGHGGPGKLRLDHAIAEIDEAIKDLRHLMLAVTQPLA